MRWQKYTILGCCLAALFLLQPLLYGQRRGGPQPSNLSPATNAALTRLAELSRFPAPAWRYNLGDLPRGEDPSLDDSSWPVAAGRTDYPANAAGSSPRFDPRAGHGYDLTGCRVLFSFRVQSSDDLQEIVYFDGRRVAMGRGLEPVDLFENAHPGDKVWSRSRYCPPRRSSTSEARRRRCNSPPAGLTRRRFMTRRFLPPICCRQSRATLQPRSRRLKQR